MKHLLPLKYIDAVARAGSIRQAAESLSITSTALNRRILAMEDELGVPIFERLTHGVRLNTAGELLIQHIRNQLSDFERLRSQIDDLAGERRGHVSIASTAAGMAYFLPSEIARYRQEHPGVTFSVKQNNREEAEAALIDHAADLALIFEPVRRPEFETIMSVRQTIVAIFRADHPLARRMYIRLRDCLQFPLALPDRTTGVRDILELAAAKAMVPLRSQVESEDALFLINHAAASDAVTFDIPLGISEQVLSSQGMTARTMDRRDAPDGFLYLGQLRGRMLAVASAKFGAQIANSLATSFDAAG
jgi:DNA-binding transcriptional LysR family regulator